MAWFEHFNSKNIILKFIVNTDVCYESTFNGTFYLTKIYLLK